ncbi:DUF2062 domain-containing protein [Arcobacteraceae bacterium]|nr:DUF2062 domain-containing protein [Arcobacteraceae bacterium]
MRKKIKKLSNSDKIQQFLIKYNIPQVYLSTNRELVSKAFLIGLFVAFIPIPMQMLVVILLMRFFKFNVPVAIALCWVSNPITMPFIFYVEYVVGAFLLNIEIDTIQMSVEWFNHNFQDIFIPLYFGAFIVSSILSTAIYFFINFLWIYLVRKNKKKHYSKR